MEERVTQLETDMEEQKRLRASQDSEHFGEKLRAQFGLIQAVAKTQSEHTATLNRHTAMHREHQVALSQVTLDVHFLRDGMQQIIGMLDTLIAREDGK